MHSRPDGLPRSQCRERMKTWELEKLGFRMVRFKNAIDGEASCPDTLEGGIAVQNWMA